MCLAPRGRLLLAFAAASLLIASATAPAQAAPVPRLDLDVTADGRVVEGAEARLEVATALATTLLSRSAVAGVEITVTWKADPGAPAVALWQGVTDAGGRANVRFVVPGSPTASRTLVVAAKLGERRALHAQAMTVADDSTVTLRADRTLYRPGSTVRWRAAWLRTANGHPVARRELHVAIFDPRGTRIWGGAVTTDARGLASGELPLADDLLTGDYELRAAAGKASDRLKVTVRPFELPAFVVDLDLDETPPGGPISGRVRARTAYGEPVVGQVRVTAQRGDGDTIELTNRETAGEEVPFTLAPAKLNVGAVTLVATVRDRADRVVTARHEVETPDGGLDVALVTAGDGLRAGAQETVHIVTTDGRGHPVPAQVTLTLRRDERTLATRSAASPGAVEIALEVPRALERRRTVVAGDLHGWELAYSPEYLRRGSPTDAVAAALEAATNALAGCLEEAPVEVRAELSGSRWSLAAARVRPFDAREDFAMDAPPEVARCLGRVVARVLPTEARAPKRTNATLEFTIARQDTEIDEEELVHSVALDVVARTADGREGRARRELRVISGSDPVHLLSLAETVVPPGGRVRVRARWDDGEGEPVIATLLRHGAPVASAIARREGDEVVAELAAPAGTYGLATVRLHQASWSPKAPKLVHRYGVATVFISPEYLDISISVPQRTTPGADTALDIAVSDREGRPVADAGLVAAVVDERLLALARPQSPLSELLLVADLETMTERAEVFSTLLGQPQRGPVEAAVMRAILASLPVEATPPQVARPARDRFVAEKKIAEDAREVVLPALTRAPGAVVEPAGADGAPTMRRPLAALLAELKWTEEAIADPFGEPRTWGALQLTHPEWTPDAWAHAVTSERLAALTERLEDQRAVVRARLRRGGSFDPAALVGAAHLAVDGWGRPFRVATELGASAVYVASAGSDGVVGSADDLIAHDIFAEVRGYYGVGLGAGGMGYGHMGASHACGGVGVVSSVTHDGAAPLRERFDETALWLVGETTGGDGRAQLPFTLPDSVTGWDVYVEAIDGVGGVGVGRARIETFLPLHVDLAAPARLTVGDQHEVAAAVANHEGGAGPFEVQLDAVDGVVVEGPSTLRLEVPNGEVRAARFTVRAERAGAARLTVALRDGSGRERDALARPITVDAAGLEQQLVRPGRLTQGQEEQTFVVPGDADPDSVRGRVRLFRGAADQARDGLEGLLREPHGCFEQTTSTTYPNLLVLQLLERAEGDNREAVALARTMVATGYQRLLRYEVHGGGFSWFGDAPANLTLTALGLVEFVDMARVYPVDPEVIARTRRWLVSRQREDGSFASVGHWGADPGALATTAWLAWALAEAGGAERAVKRALAYLNRSRRELATRPYLAALWAAAAARVDRRATPAATILEAAREASEVGASYAPEEQITLFFEGGHEARVETTALVAAARTLNHGPGAADEELNWLWSARGGRYGWGSTQATIQALRAAALAELSDAARAEGVVQVVLDGQTIGRLDLSASEVPSVTLPARLAPGTHTLRLSGPAALALRSDLRLAWRSREAPTARTEGLAVHLASAQQAVAVGGTVVMTLGVANPGAEAVAMPTIVLPVPPGFAAVRPSLERLVATTPVTRFEDLGDRVHLYLKGLAPGEGLVLSYRLEAVAPCDVAQAPAQVYAYYQPAVRGSSDALRLSAARRAPTIAATHTQAGR